MIKQTKEIVENDCCCVKDGNGRFGFLYSDKKKQILALV